MSRSFSHFYRVTSHKLARY